MIIILIERRAEKIASLLIIPKHFQVVLSYFQQNLGCPCQVDFKKQTKKNKKKKKKKKEREREIACIL